MKLLYVVKNMRLSNGVASYAMNYYRSLKEQMERFDFLVISDVGSPYYQEIEEDGNHIYLMPSYKKSPHKIIYFLKKLFKENQYDIIHCHVLNSGSLVLHEAKKQGIPVRILHSHATKTGDKKWKEYRNRLFTAVSLKNANYYFACSHLAGDYLFGTKDYTVINNAIDLSKYSFSPQKREELRSKGECGNKLIVGTVGRMTRQKNPFFTLQIVKSMKDKKKDFEFWWFGDGELENEIKEKAKELGVIDRIRFFGACKEVYAYYSALDVFVLPSVFEGLPVVGIEAQVCGLPSLFADTITAEVGISRNARFIGLDSLENWIREIETAALADRQENIASLNIDSYKIETQSSVLLQKYISLLNIEEKRRKNGKKHR